MTTLGKYTLYEELGRGGFAVVYRALDTRLNREVALKMLNASLSEDPRFVERFRLEAQTAANLKHPNIVTLYEADEVDGRLYLAMDLLPGVDLRQRIERDGPLPFPLVVGVVEQIASALAYAHARGLVHRDVKSANIIVGDSGHAALTDFGLVRAAEGSAYASSLSLSGGFAGTVEYMAPEQVEGQTATAKSDLYALGIVAYEMVAGRVPFKADTPLAVIRMQADKPAPDPRGLRPDLPEGMRLAILKALAKKPEERQGDVAAFGYEILAGWEAEKQRAAHEVDQRQETVRQAELERVNAEQRANVQRQAKLERANTDRPRALSGEHPLVKSAATIESASGNGNAPKAAAKWSLTGLSGFLLVFLMVGGCLLAGYWFIRTFSAPPTAAPTAVVATAAPTAAPQPTSRAATITLWHSYIAGGTEEQAITQLVEQYMRDNRNVTVNVQNIPYDLIFSKWQTDVASGGTAADMFTAPNDDLGNWVRAGIVAPLDTQLAGKLGGVSQTGIDGVTVDGKIYAVPGIIKALALYYNTSTITTPPATTADLLALVKSGKKLVLNENNYHNYGFFPAFGGTLMDATGKCIADQGGYADAMQYLVDLKAAGATFQTDGGKADTLFKTGAADMIINGPWVLSDYKTALGSKLGVAPMPAGPKGPAKPLAGIDGFYLNPNSTNTDAALALAEYIFSAKGLAAYADQAGDPPARTDVTVADPLVKAFADAAVAGTPRPQSVQFGNWWGPFGDMVTNVVEGQQTPADGVKAACDAMNKANNK